MADNIDISKTDLALKSFRDLKSDFTAYHARVDELRVFTRLRARPPMSLLGEDITPARLARASAIVNQARSFIQASAVTIEVEPLDNSDKEDQITSKIERWLHGVQYAVNDNISSVYRDALWHYFESGQWIVRTLFDVDRAIRGQFPYSINAIDPRTFSFRKSDEGLMYACIEEQKRAEVVLHELDSYYAKAKSPQWEIPQSLKDKDKKSIVRVMRYYDNDDEYLFVDDKPVWVKPHLMPRVPFDIAFCNDVPATGDRPEEYGTGLIYPVIDLLDGESKLMSKITGPMELFFFPMVGVRTTDAYEIQQAYPGQRWHVGTESPSPAIITPTPNYEVIDALQGRMEADISRATFPEAVFGPMDLQLSGYAYTQAMSGLQEKLKDFAKEPERALARHFSLLLSANIAFNNQAVAEELGLYGDEAAAYYKSFGVTMPETKFGYKKVKTRVELKSKEIEGHTIVRVSLQPNVDRDESAKYQRAAIAKTQLGMPDEYIIRNILQIEQPDEVMQWKRMEMLKATNPEFAEFSTDDEMGKLFAHDTEMASRFEMWRAAKEQVLADQQQQALLSGQMMPGQEMSASAPPGAASQSPEETAMQKMAGQQGAPGTGLPPGGMSIPPGAGMAGMQPPINMGLNPSSPDQQALESMTRGGM